MQDGKVFIVTNVYRIQTVVMVIVQNRVNVYANDHGVEYYATKILTTVCIISRVSTVATVQHSFI